MREISWVLLVDRGTRENPTFRWDGIQAGLDYLAEYWALRFTRTSNPRARVKFIASRSQGGPNWAAWANRSNFEIRISPTFNFGSNLLTSATTVVHEFMHLAGGSHHSSVRQDIMSPALEPGEQITQRDAQYMSAYAWKGARRPWNEPTYFRDKFTLTHRLLWVQPPKLYFPDACDQPRRWREWFDSFGSSVKGPE